MNFKKILTLSLISLCLLALIACNKSANNKEATSNNSEVKLEKVHLNEVKKDSETKAQKEILTKDINLIFVWQPSCPPCKAEAQALEQIYKDFKEVNIVGLGVAETEEPVNKAIKEWGMTFDNFFIKTQDIGKVSKNITSTPTMLVLDSQGNELKAKIVGSNSNTSDSSEIAKELKEKIQVIVNEQK